MLVIVNCPRKLASDVFENRPFKNFRKIWQEGNWPVVLCMISAPFLKARSNEDES